MGGKSAEHPISIRSAAAVVPCLRASGHELTIVGISKSGRWLLGDFDDLLARASYELAEVAEHDGDTVTLRWDGRSAWISPIENRDLAPSPIDVVFPILHGPGGEDGSIQGLLEAAGVAFVGAGCQASALAMDKLAMKFLCAGAGIPQADFLEAGSASAEQLAARIRRRFGFPCFVKPANLGSSVGISRVEKASDLSAALTEARKYDPRLVIEEALDAREIEVAMLEAEPPEVSPPGEIVPKGEFYDFEAKYLSGDAQLIAPANLDAGSYEKIRDLARKVWRLTGCRGIARADFFLGRADGRVYFNEINTLPGFTEISMFPRLWALSSYSTAQLFDLVVRGAHEAADATR